MTGARVVRDLTTTIEQHIARGHTASRIAADLNVDIDQVHAVWDTLDALVDTYEPGHPPVAALPSYWHGRPAESYFGPAAPEVIEQLVDAVCPPRSARKYRKNRAAA